MQVDPEYLRRHYGSMSDEALLDMDRSELVEAAQKCYDAEIAERGLSRGRPKANPPRTSADDPVAGDVDLAEEPAGTGDAPPWLDEAAEVYSAVVLPGTTAAEDVATAGDVLQDAGIPCYSELAEIHEERSHSPAATQRFRLLVPGNLNLQAASVLDRDLFNQAFEAEWKAHLETMSDDEVLAMSPQVVFCGLFDRVERVTNAYEQELARRGLDT